jgi:crotonobetainyl-CoA:carnitine CoA-transferase CaiB-like acyl-CoA transferase
MWPFRGVRVVEAATGIAGPLCTRLLADAGAEVTAVDLPLRDTTEVSDAWRRFLRQGKCAARWEDLGRLLAGADLVVTSLTHCDAEEFGLDCPTLLARHQDVIAACVTPFGQTGQRSGLGSNDLVLSALSGLADCTPGFPDRCAHFEDPPVQSRAPLAEAAGAFVAAVAISGAIHSRLQGAPGPRHVEVASLEATISMLVNEWGPTAYSGTVRGRRPGHMDNEPNCYLESADSWINVVGMTPGYWTALTELMGNPAWAGAPEYATPRSRGQNFRSLHERLGEWAKTQNGHEFMEAAQARGLPSCVGLELSETVASQHVADVGSVRSVDGALYPADAVVSNGVRRTRPATDDERLAPRAGRTNGEVGQGGPLSGIRVVDVTQFLAGPYAGQTLARLGAEVILVESATHHPGRNVGPFGGEPAHDASMNFNFCNRGKQSVQLNLKTDEGRRILTELIKSSDVVIENFSRRAAEKLELTYEALKEVREDIILGSISAFGRHGAWGGYTALHSGVFLMSGLAAVTRDESGRPRLPGSAVPDTLTGTFLAFAIVQAIAERSRTGRGGQVEVSMLDIALTCMGGLVPEVASGKGLDSDAGRFLPCVEPGRYVAVSDNDGQARDEMASTVAKLTRREAIETIKAAGATGAPVLDVAEVMLDPDLYARGFILADTHPVVGPRPVPATAWLYDGVRPEVGHSPRLGADTDEVLGRIAQLDAAALEALRAQGALT